VNLTPLIPIAGATLGSLAVRAWDDLRDTGESFVDMLQGQRSATATANEAAEEDQPVRAAEPQRELDAFGRQLRTRFAAAGIDVSVPVQLKSDGRDGVIVAGSHPQRAAIERLFAADPDLAATFHYLEATFSSEELLREQVTDRRFGEFRLQITDGNADVVFE
jgi:hypothetical protein